MNKFAVVALSVFLAIIVFIVGYQVGVRHAMMDSIVSVEDNLVMIEIDGEIYCHYV